MENKKIFENELFREMMKRQESERINYLKKHIDNINTYLTHNISVTGKTAYVFDSGYFELKDVKDLNFTPSDKDYEARFHFHLENSTYTIKTDFKESQND